MALKYTLIKNDEQYFKYANALEELVFNNGDQDEIELVTALIEKYDQENTITTELDPVELLRYLMDENNLKNQDIASILGCSKGLVSLIMSYKRGLSKSNIRTLADHFKLNQEAFNKEYVLKSDIRLA